MHSGGEEGAYGHNIHSRDERGCRLITKSLLCTLLGRGPLMEGVANNIKGTRSSVSIFDAYCTQLEILEPQGWHKVHFLGSRKV